MDRRAAILTHLARYRVSTRPVISKLFYEGGDPKNDLAALREKGHIAVVERALSNNTSYYHLTAAGAREIAAQGPTEAPGGRALDRDLKILYFCCQGPNPRERISEADWRQLWGRDNPPAGEHCLVPRGDMILMLRLYAPSTDVTDSISWLSRLVSESMDDSYLARLIESQQYGFAVLAPSPPYARDFDQRIRRHTGDTPPLGKMAYVVVESPPAPTPS